MQPYEPPRTLEVSPASAGGDDIELARPKAVVQAAAAAMVAAGFFSGVLVLQMLLNFRIGGLAAVMLYTLLSFAVLSMFVGTQLRRVKGWTANAAVVVSALTALTALAWGVLAVVSLVFSLLAPVAALASLLAAILAPLARSDVRRAAAARDRLRAGGLDLGT